MRNYFLKSKTDCLNLTEKLQAQKLELLKLQKGTEEFEKRLKKFIELTLFVKAHSYCLDNERERKKTTNIIFTSLLELNLLA
jgi:hypothetical protein